MRLDCTLAPRASRPSAPTSCCPRSIPALRPEGVRCGADLALGASTPLLGFAGRLVHDDAPWLLIRAALPALARDATLHVVLIGEGSQRRALERQAQRCNVGDRVHLVPPGEGTRDAIAGLDVLVLPGTTADVEAALWAMHEGVPLIAAAPGPLAGIVDPGTTGLLVGAGRTDELVEAIDAMLDDAAMRASLGAAARTAVSRAHALDVVADRLANLYARLAAVQSHDRPAPAITLSSASR